MEGAESGVSIGDRAAIAAIICAAGASARMGGIKKEYRPLPAARAYGNGLTVLGAAVTAFAKVPEIKTIVIAVPDDPVNGAAAARNALPPELFMDGASPAIRFVAGGATRQASVFNALRLLAADKVTPNFALIHDGARPWVSPSLIERVIVAVKKHSAAIPLLPLTETPKETDAPLDSSDAVFIKQHLKRAVVGSAQTPQGFAFAEIFAAHEQAAAAAAEKCAHEFTDDAELWAAFNNVPVAAILGESENRKVTFPEDLC